MITTSSPAPENRFVVVNGLRLRYLDFGGSGKPLLLLHGVTSSSSVWRDLAPLMADRRVIALDSRGHGDSQWSADHAYTTEDLASDVVEFVRSIGLESVDLAGASWGGLVGLNVAATERSVVESLTMLDIPPSFPGPPSEIHIGPGSFANHAEAIDYLMKHDEYLDENTAGALAGFDLRPGPDGRLFRKHDDYFHDNRPHRTVDYWQDLGTLQMPLLVVRAHNSPYVSNDVAQRMVEVAPQARLATLSDTGHRISVDNPVVLARTMIEFFETNG